MYNKENKMTQEQLRMQMLAGIITEGQYKAKLNEGKNKKDKKESLRQQTNSVNDTNILKNLVNDIQQKKIFTALNSSGKRTIFVDENSQYKNLIGKSPYVMDPLLGNTSYNIEPASKAEASPDKPTFDSLGSIFYALHPTRYITYKGSSYSATGADQIDFMNSGMLVDASNPKTKEILKQKENIDPFGNVREISDDTWWIDYRYRD
jgi:hypothetical protein